MGKHGPCRHCGITSTPLWRNGPPEKPVLCNACGSRWRTKGSLANYTPLHAREMIEWEEPKVTKMKSIYFKMAEQRPPKRKYMNGIVENLCEIPYCESDQNYIKAFEGDGSNRSSSGSAISYSESCVNFDAIDASDCTASAQSNSLDSIPPAPSKKRTVIKLRPSRVEKLTKELYSIWHEQQSSNLSGSSEEELLFEGEMPMGSDEIGHGGLLLRNPRSKALEEESEASSVPCDKKLIRMPCSILVDSENTGWFKKLAVNAPQEHPRRLSLENFDLLKNKESILRYSDLKEIISFEVFMEHMTNEERLRLMKYLPSIDTDKPFESIRSMFSSSQFLENLSDFKHLLQDGVFDLSGSKMNTEECRSLKRLVLLNFTKARWVQRYEVLKDIKRKNEIGVSGGESGTQFLQSSNLASIKRFHESQNQQNQG